MPLRTRIFIVIGVIILLIVGISLFIVWSSKKNTASEQTNVNNGSVSLDNVSDQVDSTSNIIDSSGNVITSTQITVKPMTTEEAEKNGALQAAKIFVERYATYSTDNSYQNVKDVQSLTTDSLWNKISGTIKSGSGSGDTVSSNFTGVTTKVISSKIEKWDTTTAELSLLVVRTEEKNSKTVTKQLTYAVDAMKVGSNWLVDGVSYE